MNSRDTLPSKIKWKKVKTNFSTINKYSVPPDVSIQGVEFTLARIYINVFCRCKHYYYVNGHRYRDTDISLSIINMHLTRKSRRQALSKISQLENKNLRTFTQQKQNPFIKLRKER